MELDSINPRELGDDRAIGYAKELVESNADNVHLFREMMLAPLVDIVTANEDLLAETYQPMVKVASKEVRQCEKKLNEILMILSDHATSNVASIHGAIQNFHNEYKGASTHDYRNDLDEPIMSGNKWHHPNPSGASKSKDTTTNSRTTLDSTARPEQSASIERTGKANGSANVYITAGDNGNNHQRYLTSQVGLPTQVGYTLDSPIRPKGSNGVTFKEPETIRVFDSPPIISNGGGSRAPMIGGQCPPGFYQQWNNQTQEYECIPACPPGYFIDAITGKCIPKPKPDPDYKCKFDDPNIDPTPVLDPPDCPPPDTKCPEGQDWWWNAKEQKYQCTDDGLPPPEPEPDHLKCENISKSIQYHVNLNACDLPEEHKKALSKCGFKVCSEGEYEPEQPKELDPVYRDLAIWAAIAIGGIPR